MKGTSEDIEIGSGRASGGRMFVRATHIPSGKSRAVVGLNGRSYRHVVQQLLEELASDSQTSFKPSKGTTDEKK
jgi:hypothetical protein